MNDEMIKRIVDNSDYREFINYLLNKASALDSVEGLEKMTNEQAGEEARVRLKARDIVFEILSPLLGHSEKKEPTAEEINSAKGKYGL